MAKDHSLKRKTPSVEQHPSKQLKFSAPAPADTSKPTAVFNPPGPRLHTVSIAIPGSIIGNAQTHDLKTTLASSIARALAVFCIDEVVIFDDGTGKNVRNNTYVDSDAASGYTAYSDPDHFLAHVLSYLETPPHLRKRLFPHHPNLRSAGSMPSLDMPHHLRADDWCRWREGVVVEDAKAAAPSGTNEYAAKQQKKGSGAEASVVDVGLQTTVRVEGNIPANTRVTLDLGDQTSQRTPLEAFATYPTAPREVDGYYWGFTVRRARSLSTILTECAFEGGYDFCVGTSERGEPVQNLLDGRKQGRPSAWKHLLLVFGGVAGLEVAVQNDADLSQTVQDPRQMFDAYLNLVPNQGSRTIRTEEAVWLGCMGLQPFVLARRET